MEVYRSLRMIVVKLKGDICQYLDSPPIKLTKKKSWIYPALFILVCGLGSQLASTETNLGKNSLPSQKFRAESDYEAHHCEPSVPLLSEA